MDGALRLSEALESWLHPREGGRAAFYRRALFLGAGFSKSCWGGAPLFADLMRELERRLDEQGGLRWKGEAKGNGATVASQDPSELVELFDHVLGRVALARGILAEPGGDRLRLYPPADPTRHPLPPRAESVFRTLKEWREVLDLHHPTHLAPLFPDGPAVLLGRLVAEGVVDEILSINWDAYVELGCLLAGVRVCDGNEDSRTKEVWLEALSRRLWVYETAAEAALRPRPRGAAVLLKLHGGVRTLRGILERLEQGKMSPLAAEAEIRRVFRVSTEDLVHWDEPARWVTEAAGDGLRSHDVLAVGLSGSDPAIYRAFRERIREWERERNGAEANLGRSAPTLVGIDLGARLRLLNMLTVDGNGSPQRCFARAGGASALRGAYSGWLLRKLIRALDGGDRRSSSLSRLLLDRWSREVDQLAGAEVERTMASPVPLVDLLCRALGPSARFAAAAEGRGAFAGWHGRSTPISRWWYAPWGAEVDEETLREVAAFVAVLTCGSDEQTPVEVDPWTGVVFVPRGHRLHRLLERPARAANLLPIVWPWRVRRGLGSQSLREELRDRFGWGPGRSFESLARAPLYLVPLPGEAGHGGHDALSVKSLPATRFEPEGGNTFWREIAEQSW